MDVESESDESGLTEEWGELATAIHQGRVDASHDPQGWTILHRAIWADAPVAIVKLMVEKLHISPNCQDLRGNTSMHDAAFQNVSEELVMYLLSAGGDPNQPNKFQETAVFEASYRARPDIMRILLENGGNPNVTTVRDESPLSAAIKAKAKLETILLLLRYGAKAPKVRMRATVYPEGIRTLNRVRTMIAIFSGRISRLKNQNSLRVLPDELLRRLNDML